MTEQEYINTKALGTITAAINTLKDLCLENLQDIIKDGESKKVLGTLYDWQDRLFKQTKNYTCPDPQHYAKQIGLIAKCSTCGATE